MKTHSRTLQVSLLGSLALLGSLLAGAGGCASADPDEADDEQLGFASQAVDLAAIPANQAAIVQDGSVPSKATGVVFIPDLDGSHNPTYVASAQYGNLPVRGSCGVTFVSPHYAITASHCFTDANAWDPANQTFVVKTFDVSTANKNEFYFDAAMTGAFPNYTPTFGQTMNQEAGYTSSTFNCKIMSRCPHPSAGGSNYNCDGVTASDVTMLRCSTRPASSKWVAIASDAATVGGALYMYWFHELFMVNNDPDMTAHYTTFSSHANNWHYLGAPTNAFLPFKSVPWPNGTQRTRTSGNGTEVFTDLYGCHGTSGSGVLTLSGGTYKLLGPVRHGGSAWGNTRLCDDPSTLTQGAPNGHGLSYTSNTLVNNLVNAKYLSTLQTDRNPPPACGDGVCNGTESHASCPSDCDEGDCPAGKWDCCGDDICRPVALCQHLPQCNL